MKGRAMAIYFALALVMVAFMGLTLGDPEPPLTAPNITIEDTFAPADDKNAYVGDTFMFMVAGYDAPFNNSNITVEITIGPLAMETMAWNATANYWEYTQEFPVDPAYVGDHIVNFTIYDTNAPTNIVYVEEMITLWHPPMLNTAHTVPTFYEDMTTAWNMTDAFLPMMDEADAYLTIGVGSGGAPEGWTFEPVMDGMYTHWHVTPPDMIEGSVDAEINVTATDTNGVMYEHLFMLSAMESNDMPMIYGIDYMGMTYEPVERSIETEWDENGTAINWTTVMVIDLPFTEDQMEANFSVNASDEETDMINLTYDIEEGDFYTLELMNESIPYWFHFISSEDVYGLWAANLTVSDGVNDVMETLWFNVSAVNDAPTIMFDDIEMGDQLDIETLEVINISVTVDDIDSEDLTIMWAIDGTEVADWNMDYFLYNWSVADKYNVSVWVSDGDMDSEVLYFWANVTEPAPTWTAEDIAVNYTEGSGDVVVADAEGILDFTYSNLRLATGYQFIDVTGIATALDGDNLKVTITFLEAPLSEPIVDGLEIKTAYYYLYFVKSTFTEPKFNQASPDLDFAPADADVYSMGFLMDYVSEMYMEITGNDMVYTIPLSDLDDAGVTPEDFNIFFVANVMHSNVLDFKMGYDSAGLNAAVHLEPATDDDDVDDDDDDGLGAGLIIIIVVVVVVLIIIILIIIFMMRGKKGEEEEIPAEGEMPPPEEGEEMPMEGEEFPMEEQPPMEGYEQPPEEPVPEEPVPEEPVPEEPVPEEPVPETPPAPQPPVPPAPAPPETPMPPQPPQ
ncbi:MAG: hypothetical protein ACMUHU_01575 [Thermoplasmatota archaeon]